MVCPDQEEVHKALPLFLLSGDTGGRGEGVMKLNPSPTSWEDLSAGGRHTDGGRKSSFKGFPQHRPPPPHLLSHLARNRPLSQELSSEDTLGQSPHHLLTVACTRWEVGSSQADQAPPIARLPRLPVTPCDTLTALLFYHHCD